jgi:hypothetical protein
MRAAHCKRDGAPAFDWPAARACAGFFQACRPWYPRDFLCLFDSLALFQFLALQGMVVDWVFGVRAEPFEAHCWLQRDDVVLNDAVERVAGFVPILVV